MKKVLSILLASCILLLSMVGCGNNNATTGNNQQNNPSDVSDGEGEASYKLGILLQNLENDFWIEMLDYQKKYCKEEYNAELTVVSYDGDDATMVSRVEDFINGGYDGFIINATNTAAAEDVCQRAQEAGIAVCAMNNIIEHSDVDYIIDNYNDGYEIARMAADWINSHDSLKNAPEVQIGILQVSYIEILGQMVDGMLAGVKDLIPNGKVVMQQDALIQSEGLEVTEAMLQAYPDMKIIMAIGDGGALGANEAVKAAGKNTDDFGIFASDGTADFVQKMVNGESTRGSVSLGGAKVQGGALIDALMNVIQDVPQDQHIYMPLEPITLDNWQEMAEKLGYDIQQ